MMMTEQGGQQEVDNDGMGPITASASACLFASGRTGGPT
jgi:hypothetical protein